jgi:putative transposase
MSLLDVSEPFIRKWVQQYKKYGIDSLQLQYKGSQGFLSPEEHRQVITFLEEKDYYSLEELQAYLLKTYHVQYKSKQSYYDLLHKAKLSWKKTEKVHPDKDETKVAERREAIKKNLSPGKRRFCRENLSSCSKMNVISSGETRSGLSGAEGIHRSKFRSKMRNLVKRIMGPSTFSLRHFICYLTMLEMESIRSPISKNFKRAIPLQNCL